MTQGPVGRRALVKASVAAGGLALIVGSPPHAKALLPVDPQMPPAYGMVGLWTRFNCDGGAEFRLSQLGADMRSVSELARASLAREQVRSLAAAHAAGQAFLQKVVADSWGVPSNECRVSAGVVLHRASGRAVRSVSWFDVV